MKPSAARWAIIAVAALAAITTTAVYQLAADAPPSRAHGPGHLFAAKLAHAGDSRKLYTCGMHPQVVQEGPGSCPICGMDLTPMKQGAGDGARPKGSSKAVTIDPVVVQNMGVRVATVKRGTLTRTVRTIGEVVVAEDLVSVVNLRFSGWIERTLRRPHGDQGARWAAALPRVLPPARRRTARVPGSATNDRQAEPAGPGGAHQARALRALTSSHRGDRHPRQSPTDDHGLRATIGLRAA
jgi:hypothetical protein